VVVVLFGAIAKGIVAAEKISWNLLAGFPLPPDPSGERAGTRSEGPCGPSEAARADAAAAEPRGARQGRVGPTRRAGSCS